ncbi:hypothetical protein [Ideonella paludis]|uniref:HDOD domain-containing protein n=1 Tax=Ideonella paludis TaxID=1233411 RepID=A0ABS5DXI8_9BURK|nr:hypothetical protein [Ideonella paludis]MBQ0935858.1 hypothetical protein [Ideonella paludis]
MKNRLLDSQRSSADRAAASAWGLLDDTRSRPPSSSGFTPFDPLAFSLADSSLADLGVDTEGLDCCTMSASPVYARSLEPLSIRLNVQRREHATDADAMLVWKSLCTHLADIKCPVWVRVNNDRWLQRLLTLDSPPNLLLEVPVFLASDDVWCSDLPPNKSRGPDLIINGRPSRKVPTQLLQRVSCVLFDRNDERRHMDPLGAAYQALRLTPFVHERCTSPEEVDASFELGAFGVVGHEWATQSPNETSTALADHRSLGAIEFFSLLMHGSSATVLHEALRRHPGLGEQLMRIASFLASLSGQQPVASLHEALSLSRRTHLARAAALMLPLVIGRHLGRTLGFPATYRALFLAHLMADQADQELRELAFMAAAVSTLPAVLQLSSDEVARLLHLPLRVKESLNRQGDLSAWIKLAEASDTLPPLEVRNAALALNIGQPDVNQTLIFSLRHTCRLWQAHWTEALSL